MADNSWIGFSDLKSQYMDPYHLSGKEAVAQLCQFCFYTLKEALIDDGVMEVSEGGDFLPE